MTITLHEQQNPNDVIRASNLIHQAMNLMTLCYYARKHPQYNVVIQMGLGQGRSPTVLRAAGSMVDYLDAITEQTLSELKSLNVDVESLVEDFKKQITAQNQQFGTPLDNASAT